MRYGSACSGIEAATVAWRPLGWQAAWFAEIEPFPSAALAHHYPDVPNLGDMTTIADRVASGEIEAPDVLCGGTPCQAFSIAGLRGSLEDERGQLTLEFVRLANAIDDIRRHRGEPECTVFWENVPGVLNTADNAFGCFLGALAGCDTAIDTPPGRSWTDAGVVAGPRRTVAWRVLDAQFFGLAQRRRRVFVVASAREGADPAAVLFEFDGVRRDSAPRREAWEVAPTIPARSTGGGSLGTGFDCADGCVEAYGGGNTSGPIEVAACLTAKGQRIDFEVETFAIQKTGPEAQAVCDTGDRTPALAAEGFDASEDGTAVGQPIIAFNARQDPDCWEERTGPIDTDGSTQAIAYSCKDYGGDAQVRRLTPAECEALMGFPRGYTLIPGKSVKKIEADYYEYLRRSYPDMSRKDAERLSKDGPRYKALGNSWAVPVVAWIGARIDAAVKANTEDRRQHDDNAVAT